MNTWDKLKKAMRELAECEWECEAEERWLFKMEAGPGDVFDPSFTYFTPTGYSHPNNALRCKELLIQLLTEGQQEIMDSEYVHIPHHVQVKHGIQGPVDYPYGLPPMTDDDVPF